MSDVTFERFENPEVIQISGITSPQGGDTLYICTGTAVFKFYPGSDDTQHKTLSFPVPNENGPLMFERGEVVATTTVASLASIMNDGSGEVLWAVDSADSDQDENTVVLTAQLAAKGDDCHFDRMSYQVTILAQSQGRAAPISLVSVTLNPTVVQRGNASQGTLTLSGPAPAGGAVITLFSFNPAVAVVPTSGVVAAGQATAVFPVSTQPVANQPSTEDRVVDIQGSFGGVTSTATLTVAKEIV